ncbi:hypothetical protein [Boudabousia marimammalium]|uniref:4-diphosphocytidyl-2-C-methyl-D-erythritol kinase n=1 Tax=Boudabousia marimammalium TaxID=156892 RepID=A0A1Q5PS73_9ACTO|nr:hypothetical protein [Boudabousia marimammalium]OKL50295.1 hypothetical protein BM477_02595 [Boudabousia marimammalium]
MNTPSAANTAAPSALTWVEASAPAKVNLILQCGAPAEAGGYHPLTTVFQALSLRETVRLQRRDDHELYLTQEARTPADEPAELAAELSDLDPAKHLAYRAVKAVLDYAGIDAGANIHVIKRVPVAGGMAGGSADAAAALLAADTLFATGLNESGELDVLAAQLGADVPFCLQGGLALGRGRGDELTALADGPTRTWVMLTNQRGLSTPGVFAQADHRHALGLEKLSELVEAEGDIAAALQISQNYLLPAEVPTELTEAQSRGLFTAENWQQFLAVLENDLQLPALDLRPDLAEIMEQAAAAQLPDGTPVVTKPIISGSGPTIAVPVQNLAEAEAVKAAVQGSETLHQAIILTGPVAGAQIDASGE